MHLRPSDLDPWPVPGRDLVATELWERSLARSRQRRALREAGRKHEVRRKGASLVVSAAVLAGPIAGPLGAARAK